jgi:hypothetical protein
MDSCRAPVARRGPRRRKHSRALVPERKLANRQDGHRERPALALLVLCEGRVPRAIEPEAAAQDVGVREEIEVIPEGIVRQLLPAALDGELVAEEDVLVSPDEPFGQLVVDPVEGDVPEPVVIGSGTNRGGEGPTPGGPGISARATRSTRSGRSAASAYPVSWPTTANHSWPRASIRATRSPASVPASYPS